MRSRDGAKVRDAAGEVVANVAYNGRLWRPRGVREEHRGGVADALRYSPVRRRVRIFAVTIATSFS
jgi:hypothetical protein